MIHVAKIHDTLYRVYRDSKHKDVWVKKGKIVPPSNPFNELDDREIIAVEQELKNTK